jgi:hypothetical protein
MISAPYLEVAVLVLGTVILLIESFSSKLDRRYPRLRRFGWTNADLPRHVSVSRRKPRRRPRPSGIFIPQTRPHSFSSESPLPPPRA